MQVDRAGVIPDTAEQSGLPWRDFKMIWLGALVLFVLIALGEWLWILRPLRLVLGFAYVLYVPGHCLMAALFPHRDDLDDVERVGLSLGLSVAIVPLLALLLDWLPWGIRLWPILLGDYGVMALCMVVALWRRSQLPVAEAYAPQLAWRPRPWWGALSTSEQRIFNLLAVSLLLAGLSLAWIFLVPSPAEFMTEFYILGREGLAEDYPRETVPGETVMVTMGIHNLEPDKRTYQVEIWAINPWTDRRELLDRQGPFHLPRGEAREWPVKWQMPWVGDDQLVEFLLFSGDNSEPYRRLRLWLNVVSDTS